MQWRKFQRTAARLTAGVGLTASLALLAACARSTTDTSPRRLHQTWSPRVVQEGQPVPRGGGSYKVGASYQIKGVWFHPTEDPTYDRQGIASWYGADFHGRKTANGEVYDMDALTAAHPTLPIPSYAYVTALDTGRTLLVRINDRGPYAHDRIIDMSRMSARLLGFHDRGTARVRVSYAGAAPLDGNERREQQFLAQQPWYRRGYAGNDGAPSDRMPAAGTSVRKPAPWGLGAAPAAIATPSPRSATPPTE